jgi:Putative Ig domain
MRRIALVVALSFVAAALAAMPGSAASFDDSKPCPADGPLLVCPTMHVGQAVQLQLIARDGCDVYRWEIVNGELPAGLKMSSSGLIAGTPTAPGTTRPWVHVHDLTAAEGGPGWCGGDNRSERQFVFTVVGGSGTPTPVPPSSSALQFTTASLANAERSWEVGRPLQVSIEVRGGTPGYSWKVSGRLPAKTALNGATGVLEGVPAESGTFPLVFTVTDSAGLSAEVRVTLNVAPRLGIATTGVGRTHVGKGYRLALVSSGGVGRLRWAVASGSLPAGLTLDARGGVISGTARRPGRYRFTVVVTDSLAAQAARTYTLRVG